MRSVEGVFCNLVTNLLRFLHYISTNSRQDNILDCRVKLDNDSERDVFLWCLPSFIPYDSADINFVMQIFHGNLYQQLFKSRLWFSQGLYIEFTGICQMHRPPIW